MILFWFLHIAKKIVPQKMSVNLCWSITKNVKMPSYSVKLGKGMFAGLTDRDWYCKYCMCHPSCGAWNGNNYRPTGMGSCSKSPTGNHVWIHD